VPPPAGILGGSRMHIIICGIRFTSVDAFLFASVGRPKFS